MDKERWTQEQCREIEGHMKENRNRQVYKLLKKIDKKWTPTQSIIKDNNGKILQDKGDIKQRWIDYCSELYQDTAKEDTVTTDLEAISPSSIDDQPGRSYPARGSGVSHQTIETKQDPRQIWHGWGGHTSGRN